MDDQITHSGERIPQKVTQTDVYADGSKYIIYSADAVTELACFCPSTILDMAEEKMGTLASTVHQIAKNARNRAVSETVSKLLGSH